MLKGKEIEAKKDVNRLSGLAAPWRILGAYCQPGFLDYNH